MHELGYDYFTIPKLTQVEIDTLVYAHNHRERKKEKELKRRNRLSKMRNTRRR